MTDTNLVNGDSHQHYREIHHHYAEECSQDDIGTFLFTSESVGEGHPVAGCVAPVSATSSGSGMIEINPELTVGDIVGFDVKCLTFNCTTDDSEESEAAVFVENVTKKAVDAFQVLMSRGREFPSAKTSSSGLKGGISGKDEMYNSLVDMFRQRKLDWPHDLAETDGKYFLQVLCNALWYVTNHHYTIQQASKSKLVRHPVPPPFDDEKFQNKNNYKKKKVKQGTLTSSELESHAEALLSILLKPNVNSSPEWEKASGEIKSLAECFSSYSDYLKEKVKSVKKNHSLDHPVRTVGENATVEYREKVHFIKSRYNRLDNVISTMKEGDYVFFDETCHLDEPFVNNMQRYRFIDELKLSKSVDIYKFCPGGSVITTVCIVVVPDGRTDPQMLTQGARFLMQHKDQFKEYHTRAQKNVFKEKLNNVSKVLPSVANLIYKELALDASQTQNPKMQERLRLIFLGEKGMIKDLRQLNSGRPGDTYNVFFEHLADVVEEVTAADDRRHGEAHLATWISLEDMIQHAVKKCPPDTPIPSKSLVRLQFAPRNPYAMRAWDFTSRINVQYKIQRRQLRQTHPDEHYCNALFKYLKEYAIEMSKKCGENVALLCCDDKAKVPIGEPGFGVSTGVRGKQSITPTTSTLVAGDHDMTKSSLTPSVVLDCAIPQSAEKSFVQGKVYVTVNDSVFQSSNPFRHAATITKLMENQPDVRVLMLYTDGGTDHRNTLVSVQCSAICIFRELDLDMIILARCAPGHSWRNPAERVMSVLNIGLQNCCLEREECAADIESELKKFSSMKEIREKASAEVKQSYVESVEPIQRIVRNRFAKLKLKDEPFGVLDSITDKQIDLLKRHLRELFPNLNLENLTKNKTRKVAEFQQWMIKHCRERQYSFQVVKCDDAGCCSARSTRLPDLHWLPDPVLTEDGEHYRSFTESVGKDTDESDRQSLRPTGQPTRTKRKRPHAETEVDQTALEPALTDDTPSEYMEVAGTEDKPSEHVEPDGTHDTHFSPQEQSVNFSMSAQTARGVVTCVECRKPRLYYSKLKLTERQKLLVAKNLSEYDFTCGSPVVHPSYKSLRGIITRNVNCGNPVELSFYSCKFISSKDICCHCGVEGGNVDFNLKSKFKSVLPMCQVCSDLGKEAVVQRPYGRKK